MRQYMKRVMLMLCMALCLFSLSACSASTTVSEEDSLDPQMVAYISQASESLLQTIASMDEASAVQSEESLLKQREDGLASGVTSWLSVMNDTGAFDSVIASDVEATEDDGFACTVMAQFANRQVEFKTFYAWDNQQQNLMPTSITFSPEYTTGERMAKAGMNTLMGMGTVFLVLIFISLLISCFKFINNFEKKMKEKESAAAAATAPAVAAAPVAVAEAEELVDDLELVAVITAAIAAATNSSTDGLVVRSIKRAPGSKWKRA